MNARNSSEELFVKIDKYSDRCLSATLHYPPNVVGLPLPSYLRHFIPTAVVDVLYKLDSLDEEPGWKHSTRDGARS
jgi:hypothetical protein